jgi:hypothetical protein
MNATKGTWLPAVQPLAGQDVSVVVAKVGSPTYAGKCFGGTLYSWNIGDPENPLGYCKIDFFVTDETEFPVGDGRGINAPAPPLLAS